MLYDKCEVLAWEKWNPERCDFSLESQLLKTSNSGVVFPCIACGTIFCSSQKWGSMWCKLRWVQIQNREHWNQNEVWIPLSSVCLPAFWETHKLLGKLCNSNPIPKTVCYTPFHIIMHFIIVFYPEHKRRVMIFMPVAMWTWFYFVAKCSCMHTVMENEKSHSTVHIK